MIAYEWETTIEFNSIRVDPQLNGKHVRVLVMIPDEMPDQQAQVRVRRQALTELLSLPVPHVADFRPARREELYDRP